MDIQLIFLIVIGLIYLGQWLVKHAAKVFGDAQQGPSSDSEDERLRKFMEALGQKPGTPPVRHQPPPIRQTPATRPIPKPMPTGRTLRPIPLPTSEGPTSKPWFEDEKEFRPAFTEKVDDLSGDVKAALSRLESGVGFVGDLENQAAWNTHEQKMKQVESVGADWRKLLSSREGLKQAIIAQEVLGTPVSLR